MNGSNNPNQISGSLFTFLSLLFRKHKVTAILVGGYALVANKVQRMTFDIDFMITASDCKKISTDLINAGYSLFHEQDAFVQFKAEKIGLRDLDFLIADAHTIEMIIASGKQTSIAGSSFFIPCPMHLIAMKLHSIAGNRKREIKDFPDVAQLLAANDINPLDELVKDLFVKYNVLDLYERLISNGAYNGK